MSSPYKRFLVLVFFLGFAIGVVRCELSCEESGMVSWFSEGVSKILDDNSRRVLLSPIGLLTSWDYPETSQDDCIDEKVVYCGANSVGSADRVLDQGVDHEASENQSVIAWIWTKALLNHIVVNK